MKSKNILVRCKISENLGEFFGVILLEGRGDFMDNGDCPGAGDFVARGDWARRGDLETTGDLEASGDFEGRGDFEADLSSSVSSVFARFPGPLNNY